MGSGHGVGGLVRGELGCALPGFDNIHRYWHSRNEMPAARIQPGEFYVTTQEEVIVTTLGSCVSACIRDPDRGVGGMNHFLLPMQAGENDAWSDSDGLNAATRYGGFAMETLINEILKNGGRRAALEVKVFGGGQIIRGMSDVGMKNITFVTDYLKTEGLTVVSKDLGGMSARIVQYFPMTGRARVKHLNKLRDQELIANEEAYRKQVEVTPSDGDIELF